MSTQKTLSGRPSDKDLAKLVEPTHLEITGEPTGFKKLSTSGEHRRKRNFRRLSPKHFDDWHNR